MLLDVSLQLAVIFYLNEDIEGILWVHVGVEVTFFNSHNPARARRDHSEAERLVCYDIT